MDKKFHSSPNYISLGKAQLLLDADRYEDAVELLLPICASNDRSEQETAYLLLIYAARQIDRPALAIKFAQKALQAELDSTDIHCETAGAYHNAKLYRQALRHYTIALRLHPDSSQANCGIGQTWLNLNNYALAERHLRKALEIHPEDPSALTLLALVFILQDNIEQGQELLQQALAIDPASEQALLFQSILEENDEKSVSWLKTILAANPLNQEAVAEYRERTAPAPFFPWLLFGFSTLLSMALLLFPSLTNITNPTIYFWAYLPGAIIIGQKWRRGLLFFLINSALLSQVKASPWPDWPPPAIPFLAAGFTFNFFILHLLFSYLAIKAQNIWHNLRQHSRQGTVMAKIRETAQEYKNEDTALILLAGGCLFLAVQFSQVMGWLAWAATMPLLLILKYRQARGRFFLNGLLAPLLSGDILIFLAVIFIPPVSSTVATFLIMLFQISVIHSQYLTKVRYEFS